MKTLLFKIVVALVTISGIACKPGPAPDLLVVIFAADSAVVIRAAQELPARPGLVLKRSDVVRTGNGTVDLQSRKGATLRLAEFTTLRIADLQAHANGSTAVELTNGSLLTRLGKSTRGYDFAVVTPTAIAGVRGTTFRVEVEDGRKPRVRVLEGRVAFRPRVPRMASTVASATREGSDLDELDQALAESEVVLEAGQTAELKGELDREIAQLDAALQANATTTAEIAATRTALRKLTAKAGAIRTESKGVTPREEADILLLVKVRPDLLDRAAKADDPERIATQIGTEYDRSVDESVERVRKKLDERRIGSEAELAREYRLIERITLVDGETLTGAIVAQAGKVLVIHTAEGVFKKNKNELDYVDVLTR